METMQVAERWSDIAKYEGRYKVSDFGRVKSLCTGKILKSAKRTDGYVIVSLYGHDYKHTSKTVHRLVANAFIDNPINKPIVNHLDGDPSNNHVPNLAWSTSRENKIHGFEIGLSKNCGENTPNSKLTNLETKVIRKLKGLMTQIEIAKVFNISAANVSMIQNGKSRIYT